LQAVLNGKHLDYTDRATQDRLLDNHRNTKPTLAKFYWTKLVTK